MKVAPPPHLIMTPSISFMCMSSQYSNDFELEIIGKMCSMGDTESKRKFQQHHVG